MPATVSPLTSGLGYRLDEPRRLRVRDLATDENVGRCDHLPVVRVVPGISDGHKGALERHTAIEPLGT